MLWKTLLSGLLALSCFGKSEACTGIMNKAENGDWVSARTMEFGANELAFELLFVPRDIAYTSILSPNQAGASWKTKYAYVGFNPFGMPIVADGLNEKGLAAGAFYFPGWAEYQQVTQEQAPSAISNLEFISWALGNFATVQEVREALKNTRVAGTEFPAWKMIPPLHYFVADKTGDRIVVEYVKGQLHIYDTPIAAITNSPDYAWHLTNARNYIGLRALNQPSIKIDGIELSQFGQGSGALGLPGDFTPPSRFIRASFLNAVVLPGKTALEQVERAFKILNQFDIPLGAVEAIVNGKKEYEETEWTSASDLSNQRYYFHTYANRDIRSVDLKALDLNAKTTKSISIDQPAQMIDISSKFKN